MSAIVVCLKILLLKRHFVILHFVILSNKYLKSSDIPAFTVCILWDWQTPAHPVLVNEV